jgi:hypothetical protein
MILIDVVERHPEFNRTENKKLLLEEPVHSVPGYVSPNKILIWKVSIIDPIDGAVDLVTVTHNEAVDPEEGDVVIKNSSRYYVTTSPKTIVKQIVRMMNDYHN